VNKIDRSSVLKDRKIEVHDLVEQQQTLWLLVICSAASVSYNSLEGIKHQQMV